MLWSRLGGSAQPLATGASLRRRLHGAAPLVGVFVAGLAWALAVALAAIHSLGLRGYLLAVDFRAYYTAGQMLWAGVRGDFYDLATQYWWQHLLMPEVPGQRFLLPFLNPPFVALALAPFTLLPLEWAYVAWAAVNVALLALTCRIVLQALGHAGPGARLCVLGLALTFVPVTFALAQGQLTFVLVLGLLLSWAALRKGDDFRGGLWLSLLLIKPQVAVVPALVLAWKGRTRGLAGLAVAGAGLLIVSLAMVGWEGLWGYVQMTLAIPAWGDAYGVHPQAMYTWRGFLHLLLGTDSAADVQTWWLLGVAVALVLLAWSWRGGWSAASPVFDLQWAALVVVALLLSPHANSHDVSVLLAPGVLIVRYLRSGRAGGVVRRVLWALPFLAYLAMWVGPVVALGLRLQPIVIVLFVALFALGWAAERDARPSALEAVR